MQQTGIFVLKNSHIKRVYICLRWGLGLLLILIGLDCANFHYSYRDYSYRDIRIANSQTYPTQLDMCWCFVQLTSARTVNSFCDYFKSNKRRICWCSFVSILGSWQQWSAELTKMALNKIQNSIQFVDGHYQVAIPWREVGFSIPNNCKMAVEQLQKLEKCLQNN